VTWIGRLFGLSSEPAAAFTVDIPPELREGWTAGGAIAPRISRAEALQVPAVLRSRNLIAGTLARLPVHVRDKDRNIAAPTTLLDQIDPNVPNVVTYAQTYEDLLLEGLSWWRVLEFGWHGYPVSAEHLSPDRVFVSGLPLPLTNGHGGMAMGPVRVYVDGRPVEDNEVIRFDSPNPPLLTHAARAIRTCARLDATAAMYGDEPLPLGYFAPRDGVTEHRSEAEIGAVLDKWEAMRRQRAWGYVGGQWEAKVLQFNAEQIQLADQRQHAVLEIARAAGIDPEDLGVSTTSRTYQNAEQRRLDLLDFTLAAYVAALEQRLSMRDILPRGYTAKVSFDGFLRSDTLTRMQAYEIGEKVGAYTVAEVRELEDRPSTPAGQPPSPVTPSPAPEAEAVPEGGT
jgi:hypothetical protein